MLDPNVVSEINAKKYFDRNRCFYFGCFVAEMCAIVKENPDVKLDEEKTWGQAPEGTTDNVPLELPILKMYHDHPTFFIKDRNPDKDLNGDGKTTFGSIILPFKCRSEQLKDEKKMQEKNKSNDKQSRRLPLFYSNTVRKSPDCCVRNKGKD